MATRRPLHGNSYHIPQDHMVWLQTSMSSNTKMEATADVNSFIDDGWWVFVFVFLILSWCCYLETHTHIQPQLSGLKRESTNVKSQIQLIANPIYFQRCKRQETGLPSSREGTGQRRRTGRNPIQASSSRIERRFFFKKFAFVIQPWWVD